MGMRIYKNHDTETVHTSQRCARRGRRDLGGLEVRKVDESKWTQATTGKTTVTLGGESFSICGQCAR